MAIENHRSRVLDLSVPAEGEEVILSIPSAASAMECAALAAAIGAHLTDRTSSSEPDGSSPVDRWKLAGRLGVRDPDRLPRGITRGEEWKAAARTWQ